jgi:hypothetical protein
MNPYLLILDDTRSLADVQHLTPEPFSRGLPVVLCKDYKAAQRHVAHVEDRCAHICFDHYLYGSPNHMELTGLDFAEWVTHYDGRRAPVLTADFTFSVHTSDPAAAAVITAVMAEHQAERRQELNGR